MKVCVSTSVRSVLIPRERIAVEIRRSYRYALRPTGAQERVLLAQLDAHRVLYNSALDHRLTAYRMAHVSITYYDQARELVAIRADDPSQQACNHSSQQHTLRRLDRAFSAFFRRAKAGQTPGFPRFKARNRFHALTFTHGDGATSTETRTIPLRHPFAATVKIQGVGAIPLVYHRRLGEREGGQMAEHVKIGTVEIIRTGDHWEAIFSCTLTIPTPKDAYPTLPATGVDVGLECYTSLADGEQVPNPRFLRKGLGEVKRLQRRFDRARKERTAEKRATKKRDAEAATAKAAGKPIPPTPPVEVWVSKRGKKRPKRTAERRARILSRTAARRYARISNQRAFFQWRLARSLISRFGLIAVEALKRRNMARRPKKTVDEGKTKEAGQPVYAPNGAAAKSGLNKSIYDAAWGLFVQRLGSKAEEAGCLIVGVRAAGTSQECPRCARKTPKALDERWHTCPCGCSLPRDVAAAQVILARGLASVAASAA